MTHQHLSDLAGKAKAFDCMQRFTKELPKSVIKNLKYVKYLLFF